MSVVGIDFGNLNTVVAVARNRGIDVIVNDVSNRATPSLVCFGEKQRFLGEAAKTNEVANFKNTVSTLKRLLARSFDDPDVQNFESKYVNCKLVPDEDGLVAAQLLYQHEQQKYSFTQLVAMFLNKVKEFSSFELKERVSDVVISCPGWFTDRQRRALLDATEIANLKSLRVINDLTAAALGYGITKSDLPDTSLDPNVKPKLVCFVDMGHSSFQVSVVSLVKGKLAVKGTAYDRHLGGRDFDEALLNHFITEFNAKHKFDLNSSAKAKFKLRQGCEKAKKILSANAMTVLNIECLLDDKDVSAKITRADFEELVKDTVARIPGPLQQAIDNAGVTIDDIEAVELVGGSCRIPIVKETLAKFFGGSLEGENKLSYTLNMDEAVARGCALQCAILSPVFRVRDFTVVDYNSFPVVLSWDPAQSPAADPSMECFAIANSIPSTKTVTLSRVLPDDGTAVSLDLTSQYTQDAFARGAPNGIGSHIGNFSLKGIKRQKERAGETRVDNDKNKLSVKFKVEVDGNGIFQISNAHLLEDFNVPVKEEKEKKSEATETTEKKVDASVPDAATGTETPPDSSTSSTEAMDTAPENDKSDAPASETPKSKRVTRKFALEVDASTFALSSEKLRNFQSLELEMEASDKLIIDTAEKRNALEEYVYETRSKLEMAWSEFVSDDTRTKFSKELNDMESWLYTEEGETSTKSVYVEKLNALKATGQSIAVRATEAEMRPHAEKSFREYVNSVILKVGSGDEKYEHISNEEMDGVKKSCQEKLDWLNDMIGKQNDKPKCEDVVVTCDEINKTKESLFYSVNAVLNKPKPKPKAPEPPKKEESKEGEEDTAMEETKGAEEKAGSAPKDENAQAVADETAVPADDKPSDMDID